MTRSAAPLALSSVMLLAACTGEDVVAFGGGGNTQPPAYCAGGGPPILVGDGITVGEGNGSSDDVCSGEVAVRTFRNALCTCEDYVTSTRLTTDSFDSAAGPYAPGGTAGPVGIDGGVQTNDVLTIGGDLTIAGAAGAALGADASIAGALAVGGRLGTAVDVTVGGDASIAGDVDLASLAVTGTLTTTPGATLAGTITAGAQTTGAVAVEPPCACAPDDLVDIGDFVSSHRLDNEDPLIGLAPDRLDGYTGDTTLELPCGRYYLGPVHGDGALTLRITGRVAVLVDGDITLTQPLTLELVGDDAELDLLVSGTLSSTGMITAGDPAHPARTRLYIGGDGTIDLSGDARFAANLYAPRATLTVSGNAVLYGSIFAGRLVQSAPIEIHYDVDVLRADVGC